MAITSAKLHEPFKLATGSVGKMEFASTNYMELRTRKAGCPFYVVNGMLMSYFNLFSTNDHPIVIYPTTKTVHRDPPVQHPQLSRATLKISLIPQSNLLRTTSNPRPIRLQMYATTITSSITRQGASNPDTEISPMITPSTTEGVFFS